VNKSLAFLSVLLSLIITFTIIPNTFAEKRLRLKYMHDENSSMFLDGRKGVRIIVDHGIRKQ